MEVEEYLRLKVDPSSDGTGKLTAEVASSGFAGRGEAYFDLQQLARFSQELRAFPLSQNNPPIIEGGFWNKEKRGVLEQVHLSIRAYQIGSKGQVGIRVRLADPPLWPDDRSESQDIAQIELMTSYAALERLRLALHGGQRPSERATRYCDYRESSRRSNEGIFY